MPNTFGRHLLGGTGIDLLLTADGSPEWKAGGVTIDWATVTAEVSDRTLADGTIIKAGAKGIDLGTVLCAKETQEVQTITVGGSPTGGTYTVTGNGNTSAAIAFDAAASAVQTAVRALGGSYAQVLVTGSAGGPYTLTFPVGSGNVVQLALGTNSLTGGTAPAPAFATSTAGDATGTYGPYSSTATDGRQNLGRGFCFILNESITELGSLGLSTIASDHPGVIYGGRVWRARLKIGSNNPTSIGGLQPTISAFETAFPRIVYVDM